MFRTAHPDWALAFGSVSVRGHSLLAHCLASRFLEFAPSLSKVRAVRLKESDKER